MNSSAYVGIFSLEKEFAAKFPLGRAILPTKKWFRKSGYGENENRRASCRQINMKNKSLGIPSFFKAVSCAAVQTTCGHEVVLQEVIGVA